MDFKKFDALNTRIFFGKYKGSTLQEILECDPQYLQWLYDVGTEGSLFQSLSIIREEIAEAVKLEESSLADEIDLCGYFDPYWD